MTFRCSVRSAARTAIAVWMLSITQDGALAHVALSGQVADETGGPLPSATITAHKLSGEPFAASSQTDYQGRYSFPELPDGDDAVEAVLKGFVSVTYQPLQVYFPAAVQRNFVLELAGFGHDAIYASSQVVGELFWRGIRVSSARICLTQSGGSHPPMCTVTNRLGQYSLDVPPALYIVTIDKAGAVHAKEQLDMSTAGEYRNKIGSTAHTTPRVLPPVIDVCSLFNDIGKYHGKIVAVRGIYWFGLRQNCARTFTTGTHVWPTVHMGNLCRPFAKP